MPDILRVGLLGAGNIGRFHAHTLGARTPDAALVAVADVAVDAARALADARGAAYWTDDPDRIFADASIAAVVIATPGATHADLIARAARAGKHVFCEKPIALDLATIDAALAAVREAGVLLQIGFQRRFDPDFVQAKRLIDAGQVGALYMIHSRTRDPALPSPDYLRVCGGLFRDTSVHDFDVVRWLSGSEVVEVSATGAALVDPSVAAAGDVDTAIITLRLANGAIATVDNSRHAVYGYDVRAEVFGAAGCLEIAAPYRTGVRALTPDGVRRDHVSGYLERFAAAYEEEIRAFVHCVRTGETPAVTGADGRAATALGLAAQESLAARRPVRL